LDGTSHASDARGAEERGGRSAARPDARDRLLDAAGAVMAARDTIDVSLQEIATEAGLNAGLVRYYFGGKEGLLVALVRRDAEVILAQLDALMAMDLSPAAKLARHIGGAVDTYFRHPYLDRLLAALLRDADSRSARDIAEFFTKPLLEAERRLIEAGIEAGELRPIEPMLFYFVAMGAASHLFAGRAELRWVFGIEGIDDALRRRYADFAVDLLLRGILADGRSLPHIMSARGTRTGGRSIGRTTGAKT
jgi:AcrR family transcriptional regulator